MTIETGSVADWVQAVGGLLSLIAALAIAGSETLRARRVEQRERRRYQAMVQEGLAQCDLIEDRCRKLYESTRGERGAAFDHDILELNDILSRGSRALSRLASLSSNEPDLAVLFAEAGDEAEPISPRVPWDDMREAVRRKGNFFMLQLRTLEEKDAQPVRPGRWIQP